MESSRLCDLESVIPSIYPPSPELCLSILLIARRSGRSVGLGADAVEDCAMEFLVHLLEDDGRRLKQAPSHPALFPWLRRCARNFACNVLRSQVAVARRQEPMVPETLDRGIGETVLRAVDRDSLRVEFWSLMFSSIRGLSRTHQEILIRFYVSGQSVEELALEMDRTPHAVEQALFRARKRLREELVRHGIDETDLLAYLRE